MGRITGCGDTGWMRAGMKLGFVFGCCIAGFAGAPDCMAGADAALVAGLGLRSRRPSVLWAIARKGVIVKISAAVFAVLIQNLPKPGILSMHFAALAPAWLLKKH
jgi:hypothetical protein